MTVAEGAEGDRTGPTAEELARAIAVIRAACPEPERLIAPPVFELVSALVPRPNVDLLIHDPARGLLLTWREDRWHGAGWHLPGGMIRLKERAVDRVHACAREELGVDVRCADTADATFELILPDVDERSHYVGLVFRCALAGAPDPDRAWSGVGTPARGQWVWHRTVPDNLLPIHDRYYRALLEQTLAAK